MTQLGKRPVGKGTRGEVEHVKRKEKNGSGSDSGKVAGPG